jgi:hypothetical protein
MATSFNGDLSDWNISSGTDFGYMLAIYLKSVPLLIFQSERSPLKDVVWSDDEY